MEMAQKRPDFCQRHFIYDCITIEDDMLHECLSLSIFFWVCGTNVGHHLIGTVLHCASSTMVHREDLFFK